LGTLEKENGSAIAWLVLAWSEVPERTVAPSRIGADGSQVVRGGWLYDTAGRLMAETNALGGFANPPAYENLDA
jgi:hypothetical protein